MRTRALIGATFVAWAFLPALALVASADEDPPLRPPDAGPPLRPPLTVLRAAEKAPLTFTLSTDQPNVSADRPKRQLIVLVGGYASESNDQTFAKFRERVAQESGYDVVRFGHDLGAYDTFGEVDGNAQRLRDSIRSVSGAYDGVHIVTHSMGGVVADRAFGLGLSASDGVTTYVAWAAPHDGAHAAERCRSRSRQWAAREDTRSFPTTYFRDPDTAAVRDLARADPSGPQPGVARLDLRLATDALVSSVDARNPGVPSRVLMPKTISELEGHGGILKSEQAFDLTLATIKSRSVPPDQRSRMLVTASEAFALKVDEYAQIVLAGVCSLVIIGGVRGLVRRTFRRTFPWPPFSE